MGPTGSGKTSLLNVLSGRVTAGGDLSGEAGWPILLASSKVPLNSRHEGHRMPLNSRHEGHRMPFNSRHEGHRMPFNSKHEGHRMPFTSRHEGHRMPFNSRHEGHRIPFNSKRVPMKWRDISSMPYYEVSVNGAPRANDFAQQVAYVMQEELLFPFLSVHETFMLHARWGLTVCS